MVSYSTNGGRRQLERRAAVRFPIEQEVCYKLLNREVTGTGKCVNISSRGLLFTTDQELEPGERLEVSVNWPAQLDDHLALKLVTTGRVVRSEPGLAAITIERYEFRTQGANRMGASAR